SENTAAVDVMNVIVLDAEIDETARLRLARTVVGDSAILFYLIAAVDVVDVQSVHVNVMHIAVIIGHKPHATPRSRSWAGVGHFEIVDLPILLVLQQHHVLRFSVAVDDWLRLATILVD